jgi:hypothetical protein
VAPAEYLPARKFVLWIRVAYQLPLRDAAQQHSDDRKKCVLPTAFHGFGGIASRNFVALLMTEKMHFAD